MSHLLKYHLQHALGRLGFIACLVSAILRPHIAFGATLQEVSAKVSRQVAAKPGEATAILERTLRALSDRERLRFAAGACSAALQGAEKDSDRVLQLFATAVAAEPRAVLGLMEIAHRAAPSRIVEITKIALNKAIGRGERDFKGGPQSDFKGPPRDLTNAILKKALTLAPDQRAALLALFGAEGLPVGAVVAAPAIIGGTINPANVGGAVISPEQ